MDRFLSRGRLEGRKADGAGGLLTEIVIVAAGPMSASADRQFSSEGSGSTSMPRGVEVAGGWAQLTKKPLLSSYFTRLLQPMIVMSPAFLA